MTDAPFTPDMAPPSMRWMGMDVVEVDPDAMTCTLTFETRPEMQNFGGVIQGGFLAAMMDDTMGFLSFVALKGKSAPGTIELHTQFLRVAPMGRKLRCEARVVKVGKSIAFTEAFIYSGDEQEPVARATASQKMRPFSGVQFETGDDNG